MKLLIVEDELKIREILAAALAEEGYTVTQAGSAEEALDLVRPLQPDVYILDVLLPGLSGFDLCRTLRERGIKEPILMLTALSGTTDKVSGLDSGADDYLTKPFEIVELKARVRALERKTRGYPQQLLTVADLVLDPNNRRATRRGEDLALSPKEFTFLEYLVRNKDQLVTRAMVSVAVWDTGTSLYTNVIDVFMTYLRKKVDGDRMPHLIHTIRGKGFMISETEPAK